MPSTSPSMAQYSSIFFENLIQQKGWPCKPHNKLYFSSEYGFPIKDASTCVPFRVYGDGADASQHFELFTILPLLCCSRSTLDNRIVTAIKYQQDYFWMSSADLGCFGVVIWSPSQLDQVLYNLIKSIIFEIGGMFGDFPFAFQKAPRHPRGSET